MLGKKSDDYQWMASVLDLASMSWNTAEISFDAPKRWAVSVAVGDNKGGERLLVLANNLHSADGVPPRLSVHCSKEGMCYWGVIAITWHR